MTDLSTDYLGLPLRTPLVASASPLTGRLDTLRALRDAGAAAVVLPSLFEEEAERTPPGEAGPARQVRLVSEAKAALDIPVIASVNGTTPGGWARYARQMAEAGADAIELNVYSVAADPGRAGAEVELDLLSVIRMVRETVGVPLAVKLSPYLSSVAHFAAAAVAAGADGLVLFNRFYQPDIDLDTLEVLPRIDLSIPAELRLPLRWLAILRPQLPGVSLGASTGVHSGRDAIKALLVGADTVMMTSALLRDGPGHLARVEAELAGWLAGREYGSVAELRGSLSSGAAADPTGFERANYLRTLASYRPAPSG